MLSSICETVRFFARCIKKDDRVFVRPRDMYPVAPPTEKPTPTQQAEIDRLKERLESTDESTIEMDVPSTARNMRG